MSSGETSFGYGTADNRQTNVYLKGGGLVRCGWFVVDDFQSQGFVILSRRSTDMATMENLWLKYSKGKFGYSVQKELWRKTKGDFENFCRRIGWTTQDSEVRFSPQKWLVSASALSLSRVAANCVPIA